MLKKRSSSNISFIEIIDKKISTYIQKIIISLTSNPISFHVGYNIIMYYNVSIEYFHDELIYKNI